MLCLSWHSNRRIGSAVSVSVIFLVIIDDWPFRDPWIGIRIYFYAEMPIVLPCPQPRQLPMFHMVYSLIIELDNT